MAGTTTSSSSCRGDEVDRSYFRSYEEINIHQEMISDKIRTMAYRLAILRNYDKIHGKVVADIGAGTGILSMFCVHAGAKRVYAVEASAMATQINIVAKDNKMADRITVVHGRVEDVDLPEKVDVIVSEWMGYFLLFETMLPSVLLARNRWLKEGGLMLPEMATLYLAPFTDSEMYDDVTSFWTEVKDTYKVDMSSLAPYAHHCMTRHVHVRTVPAEDIVAHAKPVFTLDLHKISLEELAEVKGDIHLECFGYETVHGLVSWFTVEFRKDVKLSTSPYEFPTHWQQSLLYFDEPVQVAQDSVISGNLKLSPHHINKRYFTAQVGSYGEKYYTPVLHPGCTTVGLTHFLSFWNG